MQRCCKIKTTNPLFKRNAKQSEQGKNQLACARNSGLSATYRKFSTYFTGDPRCSSDSAKNRLLPTKNNRLGVEKHTLMRFPVIYSAMVRVASICNRHVAA